MRKVLIAIDETEASTRVASFVNEFFSNQDVELIGVSVARMEPEAMPPVVGWGGVFAWLPSTADKWNERFVDTVEAAEQSAAEVVDLSGLEDAEAIGEAGYDPVAAILSAADDRDVDLIVVGNNHKNLFQRLFSSSVSQDIVKQADRPVLVVP